jgi:transcriptional regulator with XRE-family HTH domain
MTLGEKIRELREENKMLQRQLASKLEIGDAYLSKVERNQKTLNREHLIKISKLFKYPLVELETLWIGNKIYNLVKNEKQGLHALKVAETQIKYTKINAKL